LPYVVTVSLMARNLVTAKYLVKTPVRRGADGQVRGPVPPACGVMHVFPREGASVRVMHLCSITGAPRPRIPRFAPPTLKHSPRLAPDPQLGTVAAAAAPGRNGRRTGPATGAAPGREGPRGSRAARSRDR
jgi:hypothetical protein